MQEPTRPDQKRQSHQKMKGGFMVMMKIQECYKDWSWITGDGGDNHKIRVQKFFQWWKKGWAQCMNF